jgi:hypothetical protein
MKIDKKMPNAHALVAQPIRQDIFGMRSYQHMVSDVTVYSPSRNEEEQLVDAVKRLRVYEKKVVLAETENSVP